MFNRYFSVNEVLDQIANDEELNNGDVRVYVMPPDHAGIDTDEDSADEDDIPSIVNLSGRQLRARGSATVHTPSGRVFVGESEDCDAPTSKEGRTVIRSKIRKTTRWVKQDISPENESSPFTTRNWLEEKDLSPTSLFEHFFDEEVISHILDMSEKYAQQQNKKNFSLPEADLKLAIAILIISGYAPLPRRRLYWENSEDTYNPAVASSLTVNRFEEILRYLHFADNLNLPEGDKFAKMRPLFNMLNEKYLLHWVNEQNLNVDESMAPYYGRHGAKQFIRGKPIRYGFKLWCLNTPDGYLVQTEPYQGAGTVRMQTELGMGGSVVMDLISVLPEEDKYCLYFDNLFTSPALLKVIKDKGYDATGTIRVNRLNQCPLEGVDAMKKMKRGSMDHLLDPDGKIIFLRWNDNSVVTLGSTKHGITPIKNVQRFSQSEKKHIQVPCPDAVVQYNKNMGGTDRMDQNIANYRANIRMKKWWWPLFVFCLNTSTHNAWCLYRKSAAAKQRSLDYLGFLRHIALTYVHKYRGRVVINRPGAMEVSIASEVAKDKGGHYLISNPTQQRCRQCKGNTKKACSKCPSTPLHEKCFSLYHEAHQN